VCRFLDALWRLSGLEELPEMFRQRRKTHRQNNGEDLAPISLVMHGKVVTAGYEPHSNVCYGLPQHVVCGQAVEDAFGGL